MFNDTSHHTRAHMTQHTIQLIYKDLYACDLSLALSGGAIEAADKPYYLACIYSGLRTVHEFGLMHRYINANSIYVTTSGVPKVSRGLF